MSIFGNEGKVDWWYNRILPSMIIVDLALITISLILEISDEALFYIEIFDLIVCIILFYTLFKTVALDVIDISTGHNTNLRNGDEAIH